MTPQTALEISAVGGHPTAQFGVHPQWPDVQQRAGPDGRQWAESPVRRQTRGGNNGARSFGPPRRTRATARMPSHPDPSAALLDPRTSEPRGTPSPHLGLSTEAAMLIRDSTELATPRMVPSHWRTGGPITLAELTSTWTHATSGRQPATRLIELESGFRERPYSRMILHIWLAA